MFDTAQSAIKKSFLGVSSLHLFGVPMMLLSSIVLARLLTVEDFGIFTFTIAIVTVLAIPISGGLPTLLTREVAAYARDQNWPAYRSLVITSHLWVSALALVLGLGLGLWRMFSGQAFGTSTVVAAFLLPLIGFNGIRLGVLKGLGHPVLSEAPPRLIQPAILTLGYLCLAAFDVTSVDYALWVYLAAVTFVVILATVMLVRVQPKEFKNVKADQSDLSRWRSSLLPFTIFAAANTLSTQIGVLLIGAIGTAEAVAQMGVAQRGAQLAVFPLMIMNAIVGPHFVNALQPASRAKLAAVARYAARLTMLASLPIGLILLLFGKSLIHLTFGAKYDTSAYVPMAIIVVAQLTSVALGSGGMLLAMSGHEKHTLYSQGLSLLIITVLATVLIPEFGVTGAALSVGSGIIVSKVYAYLMVKRLLSVSSAIF